MGCRCAQDMDFPAADESPVKKNPRRSQRARVPAFSRNPGWLRLNLRGDDHAFATPCGGARLTMRKAASRPPVFRQDADANIPCRHPHWGGNGRRLTSISSKLATSKKSPSVRSSTSYYTLFVEGINNDGQPKTRTHHRRRSGGPCTGPIPQTAGLRSFERPRRYRGALGLAANGMNVLAAGRCHRTGTRRQR
jgi:hypothetical protein